MIINAGGIQSAIDARRYEELDVEHQRRVGSLWIEGDWVDPVATRRFHGLPAETVHIFVQQRRLSVLGSAR